MSEIALEVVRAGFFTTVQDRGRFGHRAQGVTTAGALDGVAHVVANRAVGNSDDAAALEITLGSAVFRFVRPTRFALCGADCDADLDGERVRAWSSQPAPGGSTLTLRAPARETRTMLAVRGGFDVPIVLGSRSTDATAGFGGYEGRTLRKGDALGTGDTMPDRFSGRRFTLEPPRPNACIGVLPTPRYAECSQTLQQTFREAHWEVTMQSNRMGFRLVGPHLDGMGNGSHLSHAVFPGVIQVPPSGMPIVLLNDAQTTGGYPVLGVVPRSHLRDLAQRSIGAAVCFQLISLDEARDAECGVSNYLSEIAREIESMTGPS